MKQHHSYIIAVAMFLSAGVVLASAQQVTMTTNKEGKFRICLSGSGTAVINWGYGTPTEAILSAPALNSLFWTLHSNTVKDEKTVIIYDNPGTNACDQSIATCKGWTVNIIEL